MPSRTAWNIASNTLRKDEKAAAKLDIRPDHRFVGFNAYRELLDSGVDVVLLCTPPHFRPQHLREAVEAGKHVFAEKPVAVDAPGVQSVLSSCELAKKKGVSVVSGLCIRYDNGFREAVRRIHDGAIGAVQTLFANDYRSGRWAKPRQPDWSDMLIPDAELVQLYLVVGRLQRRAARPLSRCLRVGDERQVSRSRLLGWVDERCSQIRSTARSSIISPSVYQFADGAKLVSNCRQQPRCKNDMSAQVFGTRGRAELSERRNGLRIKTDGANWTFTGPQNQMYETEHAELFASIRSGKALNNGEYMAKSTLLAIMGRMAAYTGQEITWEMALQSKENLNPDRYAWDARPPAVPIAVPGQTRFV